MGNDLYSDNWMQTIENPPKVKKLQTEEITTAVSAFFVGVYKCVWMCVSGWMCVCGCVCVLIFLSV